ncbi:MAG: ATP-dependent helicase HrpB [Actinomycetota bacterium]
MPSPGPAGPTGLPVEHVVDELRDALTARGTAVLVAEPGAGKTTVVPLRLLDEPWLGGARIVVLEPRRLATRAAARRMASLAGDRVGGLVGYTTRDERRTGPDTRIEVVTEGVLTRRLQRDPTLPGVGLVVFDEFHERSLPADLGLALALDGRASLRPDLRVLVMSATLDAGRLAELLGDGAGPAPIVEAEGRTHPVETVWRPRRQRDRLEPAVVGAVRSALADDGDVLVFLPGMGEIRRVERALDEAGLPADVDVTALHGSLPAEHQDAAVSPSPPGRRKVVLSTDVAETSLTVEGVTTVVDSGLVRTPRFDARTGMTALTTVSASRSSADQRAGRAGRVRPGTAIRLWSKLEHASRPAFTPPEIGQVDLAGLVLELALWGVTDPSELALLDQPPTRAWSEAVDLLTGLGALDADGRPTDLGRSMTELPLHPRLARMVAVHAHGRLGRLACLLAALLEDRDVLRGRLDEVPADLGVRLALLDDPGRRHPLADGRALRRARERADAIAQRAGVTGVAVDTDAAGVVLAHAYPDRVAIRRGTRSRGRFLLRTGSGAWLPDTDELADAELVVAADLDGKRKEARIRLAAAIEQSDVVELFGDAIVERSSVGWDDERDDLVARTERRLDGIPLVVTTGRPEPGPDTVRALLSRVRAEHLRPLAWDARSSSMRSRLAFLGRVDDGDWPDVSDEGLLDSLDRWVGPFLDRASGRRDLEALDVSLALGTLLDWDLGLRLAELAPERIEVPSGREVVIDYDGEQPAVAVRVQEMFGSAETPSVNGGRTPVLLQLLSPADRPIQITADLAGFWSGSWHDVRRDLAGRYPKHRWPEDPLGAEPHRR